jgi:hypothetical protein
MLHQQHADRWHLRHLVAPEPATRPTLMLAERMAAITTRLRVVRDDLST